MNKIYALCVDMQDGYTEIFYEGEADAMVSLVDLCGQFGGDLVKTEEKGLQCVLTTGILWIEEREVA